LKNGAFTYNKLLNPGSAAINHKWGKFFHPCSLLNSSALLPGVAPDPAFPSAEPEETENTYKLSLTLKSPLLPWWPGSRRSTAVYVSADPPVLFRDNQTACVSVPSSGSGDKSCFS